MLVMYIFFFFFSSRRRHTRLTCDWSSDVCSSDLHTDDRRSFQGDRGQEAAESEGVTRSESMTPRRVAITGVGLVSCLGHDYSQVVRALQSGASGLRAMPEWESLGLTSRVAGAIVDFQA